MSEQSTPPLVFGRSALPPFASLRKNWAGGEAINSPLFALMLENGRLIVEVRWTGEVDSTRGRFGEFTPELWRSDVFELFASKSQEPNSYVELNFAPSGAWWFNKYSAYRTALPPEKLEVSIPSCFVESVDLGPGKHLRWTLSPCPVDESCLVNTTAFVAGNSSHEAYLTWSNPVGGTPDFHLSELRMSARFVD